MSGDLSHEQLYAQIMAGRPDLIEEAGAFWPLLGKDFALLATKLGEEVTKSKDFWTGPAAENFRGTLTHLAAECRRFDQQTQQTHRVIASYAAHLREAQRVVPKPEPGAPAVVTDGGVGAWQAGQAHAQAQAAESEARRVHDWISHHATEHAKRFAEPKFQERLDSSGESNGTGYYAGSPNSGAGSGSRGSYGTPGITWASGGTSAAPGSDGETGTDLTSGPRTGVVPPVGTQPAGPGPGGPSGPGTVPSGPDGYVPGLPPATGISTGSGSVGARPGTAGAGGVGGGRVGSGGIAGVGPGATGGQRSAGGLPGVSSTAGPAGAGRTGSASGAGAAGMGGMPMGGSGGGAGDSGNARSPLPGYLREDPETWDVQKKGNPMVIE